MSNNIFPAILFLLMNYEIMHSSFDHKRAR